MPNGRFEVDGVDYSRRGVTRLRAGLIPLRDGTLDQAEFTRSNRMGLRPGRVKDMVEEAIANESAIRCHKTLDNSPERWPAAVCPGLLEPASGGPAAVGSDGRSDGRAGLRQLPKKPE
jgi:hypothetical protein